jgi:hypothetical protein
MCDTWQGLRVRGCGTDLVDAAMSAGSEKMLLLVESVWDTEPETVRVG